MAVVLPLNVQLCFVFLFIWIIGNIAYTSLICSILSETVNSQNLDYYSNHHHSHCTLAVFVFLLKSLPIIVG